VAHEGAVVALVSRARRLEPPGRLEVAEQLAGERHPPERGQLGSTGSGRQERQQLVHRRPLVGGHRQVKGGGVLAHVEEARRSAAHVGVQHRVAEHQPAGAALSRAQRRVGLGALEPADERRRLLGSAGCAQLADEALQRSVGPAHRARGRPQDAAAQVLVVVGGGARAGEDREGDAAREGDAHRSAPSSFGPATGGRLRERRAAPGRSRWPVGLSTRRSHLRPAAASRRRPG